MLGLQDGERAGQYPQGISAESQGNASRDRPGRENATKAFDLFVKTSKAKHPKATECLSKD